VFIAIAMQTPMRQTIDEPAARAVVALSGGPNR
jgi:hypothetical protein